MILEITILLEGPSTLIMSTVLGQNQLNNLLYRNPESSLYWYLDP